MSPNRQTDRSYLRIAWVSALTIACCVSGVASTQAETLPPAPSLGRDAEAPASGPNLPPSLPAPNPADERVERFRKDPRNKIDTFMLHRGPKGVRGEVRISGKMDVGAAKDEDPGAIGKRFLQENAELLDIADVDEDFCKPQVHMDDLGFAHVDFDRCVEGLGVWTTGLMVVLSPEGLFPERKVIQVTGWLEPLSPELKEAVHDYKKASGHFSRDEAAELISKALQADEEIEASDVHLLTEPKATIKIKPPYVTWYAHTMVRSRPNDVHRIYWIDATTGAVVERRP